ncbi:NUMOD4 motif-containing HNH endonuclease [Lacrimispora indolis]|uniref:NUMOD4 motif-containing HNH endonuclease n=1 Tax=Lacrimispora indolis TaxID=69825 RepID=UPI00045E7F2C|nr:NUMOD4 motif-containing HNH endonuclease [Lacrimispora indolis]
MTEEWKWISGFEGRYSISNMGRLKSYCSDKYGKIISLKNQHGWYFTVNLLDQGGKRHTKRIHVMVAEVFIGEIPKGYHVHHKDGNKQNNMVSNLEIIHPMKHYKETLKEHPQIVTGINYYNQYEKPKEVLMYDKQGNYLACFPNSIIAEKITGVCQRNILQVASGEEYKPGRTRKSAGGYVWKYKVERQVM